MNTPAHLIFGAAAFGRPGHARVTAAALLGGWRRTCLSTSWWLGRASSLTCLHA
ncbi:hypothetical protein [Limimaricola cinnabarinus]|uniref:Uncharacterized protein n=1 Tax=Limimaricola cinnabarinus LL-001 TaxID=1337093 RepID=U2Z0M3_9RHOB|nr:hypothetical protein MBELCI_0699 [Limimaricola cinnabarinus LL-001]